jgi:hypothetical protein
MIAVLWAALAAVAMLWPARLAGPLDGAPLDHPLEALLIGAFAGWLLVTDRRFLLHRSVRVLVISLIAWKALTTATLVQDGWCVQFRSPAPIYRENLVVPHSWDIRADWRSAVPTCSAVMTDDYPSARRFPVWFFNLPPADVGRQATDDDRPPMVTLAMSVEGYVHAKDSGVLTIALGDDVRAAVRVDESEFTRDQIMSGVTVGSGSHHVSLSAELSGDRWRLAPRWNGSNLFTATAATLAPVSALDRVVRPWGRFVPMALVVAFLVIGVASIVRRVNDTRALALVAGVAAMLATTALTGRESAMRLAPLVLFLVAAVDLPRRLRNTFGMTLLVGLPFLAMFMVIAAPQAGVVTWYTSGDDWWMFQRWAYRIFLQGYWLEGGQVTFWFQPLYRWIAGGIHMLFGDSSVGELFWDVGGVLTGALFAFHVTRVFAGFRWAVVAGVMTLAIFTLGPAWYLFGRGLSEISSAGLIYAAALLALRGRHGYWPAAIAAGALATLGAYTRLNNLPMAVAVAVFAFPVRQQVDGLFRPSVWLARASREVLAGVFGMISLGLWLFTARTYYYTKVPSMLFGTTATLNSVWQSTDGVLDSISRVLSSVLMLLTMNDPPRFDLRALPVIAGMIVALLGVARVGIFRRLPLNLCAFGLASIVGALVARGTAYPGRFSVHLIPVTVALTVCALSLFATRSRSTPRAHQSRETT